MSISNPGDIRITRRGKVAVGVIVLAVVMGWLFGPRGLNFIAAPTLAALLLGAVHVRRAHRPEITATAVDAGFPGDRRTLSVTVSGSGIATVVLQLPDGAGGEQINATVTLPHTFELETTLQTRGIYEVGPPTVRQRGVLGLIERPVETETMTTLAVYPERYGLVRDGVVSQFFTDELDTERQEFDRLREYTPEDPLRHIHWKSSAKHGEFLVMEFAPTRRTETVTIAAEATTDLADEMARACATIADAALGSGLEVELVVPDGVLQPGQGTTHRKNLLGLLASTGPGTVPGPITSEADVAISATETETTVRIGTRKYSLSEIITGERKTPSVEVEK